MDHQEEKEEFCQLMASLFSPPDDEMVRQVHMGTLYSFFQGWVHRLGGDTGALKGFTMEGDPEILLEKLRKEYERLFTGSGEESISLVESFYKPWTLDSRCSLSFASSRGLLMGDSALHMLEIYRQCGLETTDGFESCPDHLVLELEFLSYLYRWATDTEIRKFIEEHLDWISPVKKGLESVHPHPFYGGLLEVLSLFLDHERKRLEIEKNGSEVIH